MWNLSRKAIKELAEELHLNIDIDTLWKLTGGNPRVLHVIAIQGVEKWFKEEILKDVRNLYRDALEIFRDREVTCQYIITTIYAEKKYGYIHRCSNTSIRAPH
jgi:hypothetical protein